MGNEIAGQGLPKGANGLTLPLSKSLGSRDLQEHRAMVAMEMEILAKKTDRFGWERDRNTPAHDRLILDWMGALQDFPLDEIRAAIKAAMDEKPGRTLNEREVLFQVHKGRARQLLLQRALVKAPPQYPERRPATAEEARNILEQYGFAPKRMKGD